MQSHILLQWGIRTVALCTTAVKRGIFAQRFCCGKKHQPRKSGRIVEGRRIFLCELFLNIHIPLHLWKTPVEKPVEIVENYELSTGISLLWKFLPGCGKVCIPVCITPVAVLVTSPAEGKSFLSKVCQKVYNL